MTRTAILSSADRPLAAGVLDRQAEGFGLAVGATLRSAVASPSSDATTLLVFLRHFG